MTRNEYLMMVGNRLRRLRRKQMYSRSNFARIIEATPRQVARWERGEAAIPLRRLPKIARALRLLSYDELLW